MRVPGCLVREGISARRNQGSEAIVLSSTARRRGPRRARSWRFS